MKTILMLALKYKAFSNIFKHVNCSTLLFDHEAKKFILHYMQTEVGAYLSSETSVIYEYKFPNDYIILQFAI